MWTTMILCLPYACQFWREWEPCIPFAPYLIFNSIVLLYTVAVHCHNLLINAIESLFTFPLLTSTWYSKTGSLMSSHEPLVSALFIYFTPFLFTHWCNVYIAALLRFHLLIRLPPNRRSFKWWVIRFMFNNPHWMGPFETLIHTNVWQFPNSI